MRMWIPSAANPGGLARMARIIMARPNAIVALDKAPSMWWFVRIVPSREPDANSRTTRMTLTSADVPPIAGVAGDAGTPRATLHPATPQRTHRPGRRQARQDDPGGSRDGGLQSENDGLEPRRDAHRVVETSQCGGGRRGVAPGSRQHRTSWGGPRRCCLLIGPFRAISAGKADNRVRTRTRPDDAVCFSGAWLRCRGGGPARAARRAVTFAQQADRWPGRSFMSGTPTDQPGRQRPRPRRTEVIRIATSSSKPDTVVSGTLLSGDYRGRLENVELTRPTGKSPADELLPQRPSAGDCPSSWLGTHRSSTPSFTRLLQALSCDRTRHVGSSRDEYRRTRRLINNDRVLVIHTRRDSQRVVLWHEWFLHCHNPDAPLRIDAIHGPEGRCERSERDDDGRSLRV